MDNHSVQRDPNIFKQLFHDVPGEISISLSDGTTFTSADYDELAAAAEADPDPWIDLVTSAGQAIGVFVLGDGREASPPPSVVLGDGMIYMINGPAVEGYTNHLHIAPLSAFGPDEPWPEHWYKADELVWKTPSSDVVVRLSTGRQRQEQQGKWKTTPGPFGLFADALLQHSEGQKDGPCFLQGECAGGSRKAAAMIANYVLGVDLDSGAPLAQVMDTIRNANLEAVIYTTHSHLKNTSVIKRDAFIKWANGQYEPTDTAGLREYLIDKKGVLPEILDEISVFDDAMHTEDGVVILVAHLPMPKFRAVFPLSEAFVFAKRGGTQQDAIAEWKERYAGVCTKLGLFFDEKCVDPARLFYLPRHKKGDAFGAWHIIGKPLDLTKYERVKMRRGKDGKRSAIANNAFTAAAGDQVEDDPDRYVINGYNLRPWAAKNAKRFEIESMIQDLNPDLIREGRGNKSGVHIACPFEDEHTNFGGGGTFVVNASDAADEGSEAGFAFVCTHNACSERDRLDFIKGLIEQEYIEIGDLSNRDYLLELEDEDDDVAVGSDGIPAFIAERNKRMALVKVDGKTRILEEPKNNVGFPEYYSVNDMIAFEQNNTIAVSVNGKLVEQEEMKLWLKSEHRRSYDSVRFEPGSNDSNFYNLFRGFNIQAKQGSWSLLKGHIFDQICDGDEDLFEYFMTYLAHVVNFPGVKPGVSLVITGEKGTGKSTPFDIFQEIFQPYVYVASQAHQITGRFNGHIANSLIVVCEEAVFTTDPKADSVIKELITGNILGTEKKGYDAKMTRNFTRLVMISNEAHVIDATFGSERRYTVFKCNNTKKGDFQFFSDLRHQMANGGAEAMFFDLVHWKPKNGWESVRRAVQTSGLHDQMAGSLTGAPKFMYDLAVNGLYEPMDDQLETLELSETVATEISVVELKKLVDDCLRHEGGFARPKLQGDAVVKFAQEWCDARVFKVRPAGKQNQRTMISFPPRSQIRAHIQARKGFDIGPVPLPVDELEQVDEHKVVPFAKRYIAA